jgi:hypothetical protein
MAKRITSGTIQFLFSFGMVDRRHGAIMAETTIKTRLSKNNKISDLIEVIYPFL